MKKRIRLIAVLAALAMVVAACGTGEAADDGEDGEPTTTTTSPPETTTTQAPTTTTTEGEPIELVIWADEGRSEVFSTVTPAFTEETGVEVTIEVVDFGEIRNQVQVAGPAGEGPDLFIGAHDWTGELAANGAVEAIDLGARSGEFFDVAINAFSFGGSLYAVPYATEAIALYYNADLVPTPPATFDELKTICDDLGDAISSCLGVPGGGDGADAYHNYPFVSALGGYIFAYDPATGYDPTDVGLDSEGAIAGIEFMAQLVADGYLSSTNYGDASTLFQNQEQAFWMTGPWELGNLNGTDEDGNPNFPFNWGVAKIPTIEGNAPGPFVGAQGVFLSSFSENKLVATSLLLDFLATVDTMKALYDQESRNPAHVPTFDLISDDPVAATFALSAADGQPMPNIPEMGNVWGPLGDNLLTVRNGEISATDAMTFAAEAVRAAVGG